MTFNVVFRSNWEYLVDHADKPEPELGDEQLHERRERAEDYYSAGVTHGKEPPGVWHGEGARLMGLEGEVSARLMAKVYGKLEHPLTGEALGSRPRNYADRETRIQRLLADKPFATADERALIELQADKGHREARNYIDAPYAPFKSVTALYVALEATGRHEEAEVIKAAMRRTVEAIVDMTQKEAAISRRGHHGKTVGGYSSGEYVEGGPLVVSLWDHTTNRNGDPHLHTHIAILNRVLCDDGVWRALHGSALVGLKRAIGEMADRLLAEDLQKNLGIRTVARADGKGWEIEGVTQEDIDLWSSRSHGKAPQVAEWVQEYKTKWGHDPDALTLDRMNQAAILLTRRPKPAEGKEMPQKITDWEAQYEALRGQSLEDLVQRVGISHERPKSVHATWDRGAIVEMAIAKVGETREVWSRDDLRAAVFQVLPQGYLGRANADELMSYIDSLADEALRNDGVFKLTSPAAVVVPDALKRSNGRSIYEPNTVERYSTQEQYRGEQSLIGGLHQAGGAHMSAPDAERLIMETTAKPDQAAVLRELLTSDRQAIVINTAAGAGKSFTMAAFDQAWRYGIGGRVVGTTMSRNAAEVMRNEGVQAAFNSHELLRAHEVLTWSHLPAGMREDIEKTYGIGPQDCIVVDEAGTMSDAQLMKLDELRKTTGARIVYVGDTEQMVSGAAFRLLANEVEPLRLETVRRFRNEWEGPASLRLRDGDISVLREYDRQGRIVGGSREEVTEKAISHYVADRVAGRQSLLMVGTCDHADEVAMQVREKLVELGIVDAHGVVLHNGTIAGAGDLIQARLNVREFEDLDPGDPVINRQVYRVERVEDGALVVRLQTGPDEWAAERTLPADYVESDVERADIVTVMGAQGRTVQRGYVIPTEGMTRNHFYPALTRGWEYNIAFVPVEEDEHAVAVVEGILANSSTRQSATEVLREEETNPRHLARLGPIYDGELGKLARDQHEAIVTNVLGPLATRMQRDEAAPALYSLLRSVELEGHDVETVVREAVESRELDTARSVAKVLHSRITDSVRPVREAEEFQPTRYTQRVPEPTDEITQHLHDTAEVMDGRIEALSAEILTEPPQ